MKNAVSEGKTLNYTNTSGSTIPSGRLIKSGHTLGWAIADIPNNTTGALRIRGAGTAPKVSGAVFVVGEKLIFDVSQGSGVGAFDDSLATAQTGDVTGAAIAAAAGADGETTCTIILTPGNAAVAT